MKISDRITLETFKKYNPIPSKTDLFYCGIANNLMKIIRNEIPEYPASYCCDMTVSLAKYFEDVVSDLGTWRAFTETHQARYGRPLPFYDLSGIDEYYPDEIHLQDVRFLIWNVMQSFEDETFINPEDERIEKLARKITDILLEKYDEAPVNYDLLMHLYDYEDTPKDRWMFRAREVALWLSSFNFLTSALNPEILYNEKCSEVGKIFRSGDVGYCARAYITVNESYGSLNMTGFEWYAAMCRNADLYDSKELSNLIDGLAFKELSAFRVESHDEETITFRGADDDCFTMNKLEIDTHDTMSVNETLKGHNCIIAAFLRWGGNWLPWGFVLWQSDDSQYLKLKDIKDRIKRTAEIVPQRIQEKCGHQRMFYLKNIDEMAAFNKEMLCIENEIKSSEELPYDIPKDVPIALWLDDKTGDFSVIPFAQYLNDPDNPYYNPSESPQGAFEFIMLGNLIMDKSTMDYLVNQGLLKDAACESSYGKERGHKLVQENIKFLCDYFRSN